MDKIDKKILRILQHEGRITSKAISERVGLSNPAVLERIRKMESVGIIEGYKAIINHKKIGKSGKAILSITFDRKYVDTLEEIKESIINCGFVESYYFTTGKYDFILSVSFEDIEDLEDILMRRLPVVIPFIKNIETFVVLSGEENLGYDI
ncbi:MAG TPA: Lrp/AsnC family transcriptional regulator [Candidatus Mcinerneyibacterium sp.]|nr:Lrp/AsnC family transcriptional regulator [Candidatus Mcinerneyibacterium sp.]